jgi:hypothetical protein
MLGQDGPVTREVRERERGRWFSRRVSGDRAAWMTAYNEPPLLHRDGEQGLEQQPFIDRHWLFYNGPLRRDTVLEYFALSKFYDRRSSNEELRLQNIKVIFHRCCAARIAPPCAVPWFTA